MLTSNDVVNLERKPVIRKRDAAVLAAHARPAPNLFVIRVHCGLAELAWAAR
jgi:hypothetical protein